MENLEKGALLDFQDGGARGHQILQQLDPDVVVLLRGASKTDGAQFFADGIPGLELSVTSYMIIKQRPVILVLVHTHPLWLF